MVQGIINKNLTGGNMVQGILGKLNLDNLTQEEREFLTNVLTAAGDELHKKAIAKAEKMAQNKEILDTMNELLDTQGKFTTREIFDLLDGKYTLQKISYVARELANVKAVDNPLYAVKVYKRP